MSNEFPNEAQKNSYICRTKNHLFCKAKHASDLLYRELYMPESLTDGERIELEEIKNLTENFVKTHPYKSYSEFKSELASGK